MEQTLHLHEFFVEGNNPEESHVLLNITEPSTLAEKDKGYFFVICEINNAETKYIAKMQSIVDEIENSYYEIPDETNQTALEIVLNKINEENISMIQSEITLNCIIGVIRENEIIFSFYGHPQMILFYKTKDGIYKKMDLVEENKPDEGTENSQLFSQLVQGKIGPSDYFFAGTPNIINYFNHDRLQKIITTRLPRLSSEHLQRVLSELRSNLSFGGIIVNLQKGDNAISTTKISPIKKGSSARSLKNLFGAEKNTADILSSSFLPKFQEKISSALEDEEDPEMMSAYNPGLRANTEITSSHLRARHEKIKDISSASWQETAKKITLFFWKMLKYAGRGLFLFALLIASIFSRIGRTILLLFFVVSNYQDRRRNILTAWARWWQNLKENIKRLPLVTKILLIATLVLAIAFSNGIWYIKTKQKNQARTQAFIQAMDAIKAKQDTASGFLVYGDTEGALDKLNEAKGILKALICESNSEKTTCQNTEKELNSLLMKARKISVVQPELLVDWSKLTPATNADHTFILNNKVYGFGADNANIVSYDLLTKESALTTPPIAVKNFRDVSVPKENDYAILLYEDKNIAQFNPQDNSWKKIDISFPSPNAKISSAIVYNRRVYSLDTANNQIYKHDVITNGFSLGKPWLQDNSTDLSAGVDIAVDGDVFVLSQNGVINKFTKGQLQNFNLSKIEPPLSSADKIWTYNDLKFIYVLDTAGKRILIIDKMGQVKNQITADEFNKPTAMIVDEPKNIAYILDSDKLYQISLK
jgi:hypothetical protein